MPLKIDSNRSNTNSNGMSEQNKEQNDEYFSEDEIDAIQLAAAQENLKELEQN